MNINKQLNELIKYIENNLENKVDYKKMASILATNPYVMQRLFYLMTNITVAEYIKKRRLSKAVSEILKGKKIIDIAIKYQYSSSEAFSRAFKTMHGINPSLLKKEDLKLELMPILKFNENNNSYNPNINYQIVKNKGFNLYTKSFKSTASEVSKYTTQFWQKEKENTPAFSKAPKRFGIVEYKKNPNDVNYHIGLETTFINSKKLIIPKTNWLVLNINSTQAEAIDTLSKIVYEEYSKAIGYHITPTYDLELYYENNVELWFPFH